MGRYRDERNLETREDILGKKSQRVKLVLLDERTGHRNELCRIWSWLQKRGNLEET